MNGILIKYEVQANKLTLTIELTSGSEVTVSISADVTEAMTADYYTVTFPDRPRPYAAKITRTIVRPTPKIGAARQTLLFWGILFSGSPC